MTGFSQHSCKTMFLIISIGLSVVLGAPQARKISGRTPISQELHDMLNLEGSYSNREFDLSILTLSATKEFFQHEHLVESLVDCFDIDLNYCEYPGIARLTDEVGVSFDPGDGCSTCSPKLREIIRYASSQFQQNYKKLWRRFVVLLSDFLGGII